MHLTISKKDLATALGSATSVAEKKSTMPVLACVRLTADRALRCEATDLYLGIGTNIPADVERPGSFAVHAGDLLARVKMMPDGPVLIEAKENALTLKAKGLARRYTLRGMSGDDFPPMAKPDPNAAHITLDAGVLGEIITHTVFAISTDESRPHINSALVELDGGLVRMVATDGHRLALCERKVEGHASATMLLPLKAVQEVRRMADALRAGSDEAKSLRITRSGAHAFFVAGDTTFSTKLVDAQFPPYVQVIPKQVERVVRTARVALADALKAVSVSASDRTGGVKLSLSNGVLRVSSEDVDRGEGFDEVPYTLQSGKDGALVGLNAKYPLDVLGALPSDEVELGVSGELDPITIRPVGEATGESVNVLMPLRI